jgi:hypothetical protein
MFDKDQFALRFASTLMVALVLAACGGTPALVSDRLDPLTGVTVTSVTKPLVFYRDRSAQAAYAKDYVYLGPVEVNTMGRRDYFLWLGIWGSSDSADRSKQMDNFESIVVYADGEPLNLEVKGWTPASIGLSESVYVKPVASATDGYYRVTIDQIRLMAEARDLEIRAGSTHPHRYTLWDSASTTSASMQAFVREVL